MAILIGWDVGCMGIKRKRWQPEQFKDQSSAPARWCGSSDAPQPYLSIYIYMRIYMSTTATIAATTTTVRVLLQPTCAFYDRVRTCTATPTLKATTTFSHYNFMFFSIPSVTISGTILFPSPGGAKVLRDIDIYMYIK
jgi:hypothetical protein